jgi:hypothetical protein
MAFQKMAASPLGVGSPLKKSSCNNWQPVDFKPLGQKATAGGLRIAVNLADGSTNLASRGCEVPVSRPGEDWNHAPFATEHGESRLVLKMD